MRPRPPAEAYLRLRTLPGEQAQVDWGHFGHLQIGRARRPLMAFVMVLSHSRMVFLRFFLDARMDSFLRGHVLAFIAFGGVPRVLLYDNLKSAVLERQGDAIRFNPTLLALAGHYRFEPRPVAVARGNEKGRVERAIRYIRDSFFAARTFTDLDDLNAQAAQWCRAQAADRRWVEDSALSVRQAFEAERGKLLALPQHEFALGERVAVTVGKTPYVRFDLNDYSVPHTHVRRTLTVLADEHTVRILDGAAELARHARCWDRGQQIEDPGPRAAAGRAQACGAGPPRLRPPGAGRAGQRHLARSAPVRVATTWARSRRRCCACSIATVRRRCKLAILEALQRDVPHPNAVRLALERAREDSGQPPPVALVLPEHVARRDAPVRPHALDSYDRSDNDRPESTDE